MRPFHHITAHRQALPQLQPRHPLAPGLIHLAATAVGPELLRPEGTGLRRAGTHLQTGGEPPQAVHRPGTGGFKQGRERVAQEATTGHHRQTGRLVDHQQVAVVVDRLPLIGDRLLQPGRTPPTEGLTALQGSINGQQRSVPIQLTGGDPLLPQHSIRVAVAIRQPFAHQDAGSGPRHPVAVGPTVVERRLAPTSLQVTRRCSRA